ncbi:hypothetical protein CSC79_00080 [Pseudoalteromonas sp. 3D05]|nr:hypothetical protein CSC79_00080 [Pseudoalteromonas sp. 3D05]TGE85224.1 hypothetical protein C7Y70_02490 [Pseudoalteromonas sp. KS88]
MSSVLLILGICFMCAGLLPLLRWFKSKVSKHHWRVCEIDNITVAVNNRIASLELAQQQTMMVSFWFEGHIYSVMVDYSESLFLRFKQEKPCTILVDTNNPLNVYSNIYMWHGFALSWLLAGCVLILASYLI